MARAILIQQEDAPIVRERRKSSIATLRAVSPAAVLTLKEEFLREARPVLTRRAIWTLEEAIAFARENPAR
jgi:hypothetical protein